MVREEHQSVSKGKVSRIVVIKKKKKARSVHLRREGGPASSASLPACSAHLQPLPNVFMAQVVCMECVLLYVPFPCGSNAVCSSFRLTQDVFLAISGLFPGPGGSSAHWCTPATQLPPSLSPCRTTPVCLVADPAACSQVCRPPEAHLIELRRLISLLYAQVVG